MKLDPQLAFYFKHQEFIDAWAVLRDRAPGEAHKFFCSLAEPLQALVAGRDDVEPWIHLDGGHPKLFLVRPAWRGSAGGQPRVAIGLEWNRRAADFARAYTGVWVDRGSSEGRLLEEPLRDALAEVRSREAMETRAWWPAFRFEAPRAASWWDDLDAWRSELLARLEARWSALSPAVDAVYGGFQVSLQAEQAFVAELDDALERLAGELGDGVQVLRRLAGEFPGLAIHHRSWSTTGPRLGVEWQPGQASTGAVWIGASLSRGASGFQELYAAIRAAAPRELLESPWRSTEAWPIARRMDFSREQGARIAEIVSAVRALWASLGPVVARVNKDTEWPA